MALSEEYVSSIEQRLAGFSPILHQAFTDSLAKTKDVPDEDLERWIDKGISLAGHSLRSWEAAAEFFRAGPLVLNGLDAATFAIWIDTGEELAEMAPAVAAAYFRASAGALPYLTGPQIAEWAGLGKRLYKGTWKSISLASDFLGGSPALLKTMTL